MASGRLVLVPTPIGNLEDLSPRARREIAEADGVLAEDTRRTRALLSHLGLAGKPLERLDAEVEHRGLERVIQRLRGGARLALVSDAGMPVVSDPGAALVRAAIAAGAEVCALPGPSAVVTALAASGFAGERFRFLGFLPRAGPARRQMLTIIGETEETVVFFESPARMARSLAELARSVPEREAAVARELSKVHEEIVRGTLAELAAEERSWRGELTVVLGPHARARSRWSESELDARARELRAAGMRARDIAKALSLESGWPSRAIYQRITRD